MLHFLLQGVSLEGSHRHSEAYTSVTGLANQGKGGESTPYSSWKPAGVPSQVGGVPLSSAPNAVLVPVEAPIAGVSVVELLAKMPNHQSNVRKKIR